MILYYYSISGNKVGSDGGIGDIKSKIFVEAIDIAISIKCTQWTSVPEVFDNTLFCRYAMKKIPKRCPSNLKSAFIVITSNDQCKSQVEVLELASCRLFDLIAANCEPNDLIKIIKKLIFL